MTRHLRPEEFVDAIDQTLSADRAAHMAVCAHCAEAMADMRRMLHAVDGTGDVPEPSPLFWEHLSERVRGAVRDVPALTRWWQTWRGWGPLVAATAMVAMALTVRPGSVPAHLDRAEAAAAVSFGPESDAMWNMITSLAPEIAADQAFEAGLTPEPGTTDAAIASLTQAQRRELLRLLKAEIGAE